MILLQLFCFIGTAAGYQEILGQEQEQEHELSTSVIWVEYGWGQSGDASLTV